MSKLTSEQKENVMIVKRTFDAPIELVFEVHSNCKHLMKWYGGYKWPLDKCEMDFREGGRWLYCFKMPDEEACGLAVYKEINRPDKIVYKDHFLDETGKISNELPSSIISLEFIEENGRTTLLNRWEYPSEEDLDLMLEMGAIEGLSEIWDRLEEHLADIQ
jgi:uncharacterized protein YndB with AHSA1/START domain